MSTTEEKPPAADGTSSSRATAATAHIALHV